MIAADRRFTAGALLTVGVVAWWLTARVAGQMCCMLDGLAKAGRAMPFDGHPIGFAGVWTVMMAAMMLPGIIPAVVASRSSNGVVVAAGYLAVWIATGAAAFGALIALNSVGEPGAWLDRGGGALVVFAGAYQFSGWKRGILQWYDRGDHITSGKGAFEIGLAHGLRCLGASWALMAVLLVVGVMNIAWMAVIAAICLGEKVLSHRAALATTVGVSLAAMGLVIMADPRMLGVIAGVG